MEITITGTAEEIKELFRTDESSREQFVEKFARDLYKFNRSYNNAEKYDVTSQGTIGKN